MKQIAVVSGKGGTGKTTLVACLAHQADSLVMADCDVDASNLALLFPGDDGNREAFYAGQRAKVEAERCQHCGTCVENCRFDAIEKKDDHDVNGPFIDPLACEGCGVCQMVCPSDAVILSPNLAGSWCVRESSQGPLVHAELGVAQDNSGKLVAKVREVARALAQEKQISLVLIDGPPGIGCPVHASITGVNLLLGVTEPTPSGVHDLERLLNLARTFRTKAAIVINKEDMSAAYVHAIESLSKRFEAPIVGKLPFDVRLPKLLAQRKLPLDYRPFAEKVEKIWSQLRDYMADI